jgi:hypothetical protein
MEDTRRPITDHLPLGPGAEELSKLLDSLVALRLEIARGTSGEEVNFVEAQAALDTAIQKVRRLLDRTDRRHSSAPRSGDGQGTSHGLE